jgi:hypothetical protein
MEYQHRVNMKWNQIPETEYKRMYDALKVELIEAPSYNELCTFIPQFGEATWEDHPKDVYSKAESEECVNDMFAGKYVPTALETVNIIVRVSGIDICDVTHFLRHRSFSFSAQCTGDRDLRHDPVIVKEAILKNDEFYERYVDIVEQAKMLYADMVDSKEVSLLDARTILPRNTETYYYIKGPLNAWLAFIKARTDVQIQPKSDVLMGMKVYEILCDLYPPLRGVIDVAGPDWWYINTVNTKRSSNMMFPRHENYDLVERAIGKKPDPKDFVYGEKTVGDFPGDTEFLAMLKEHKDYYGK